MVDMEPLASWRQVPGTTRTDLLAAIVRGGRIVDGALAGGDAAEFCALAAEHGVLPLVADRLAGCGDVPADLRVMLREHARSAALADLVRESELKTVLAALQHAGLSVLLIKGGQLAYSHYPRPDLRPREDTD